MLIAEPEPGADAFWDLDTDWNNSFRFAELESLVDLLQEHIEANRLTARACAMILWRQGRAAMRTYQMDKALTVLTAAKEATGDEQSLDGQRAEGDGGCAELPQGNGRGVGEL